MFPPLKRLPRLLERAAFLGLVWFTMLLAAGSSRAAWTAEGSMEETVHSAQECTSVLRLAVVGGDADDDGVSDVPLCEFSNAGAVSPANAIGVRAIHTEAPTSPARFLPAARGPPMRA